MSHTFDAGLSNQQATYANLLRENSDPEVGPDLDISPKNARVLLVDDKPELLSSLSQLISLHEYPVVEALGGRAALDALQSDEFDVVLLDLIMPEISGHDVLEWVADHEVGAKVVVVSGDSSGS